MDAPDHTPGPTEETVRARIRDHAHWQVRSQTSRSGTACTNVADVRAVIDCTPPAPVNTAVHSRLSVLRRVYPIRSQLNRYHSRAVRGAGGTGPGLVLGHESHVAPGHRASIALPVGHARGDRGSGGHAQRHRYPDRPRRERSRGPLSCPLPATGSKRRIGIMTFAGEGSSLGRVPHACPIVVCQRQSSLMALWCSS